MSAPATPPEAPLVLAGRYLVLWELRATSSGTVMVAEDMTLTRLVEVRVLPAAASADPLQRARFVAAARASAGLPSHPGLLAVYDQGEHEGQPFVVCERCSGPTLERLAANGERLTPARVAEVGADVAEALAAVHQAGVVHGNVTSRSIVLRSGGHATVSALRAGAGRGQAGDVADLALTLLGCLGDTDEEPGAPEQELRDVLERAAFAAPPSLPRGADGLAATLRQLGPGLQGRPRDPGDATGAFPTAPTLLVEADPTREVPLAAPTATASGGGGLPDGPRHRRPRRRAVAAGLAGLAALAAVTTGTYELASGHTPATTSSGDRRSPGSSTSTPSISTTTDPAVPGAESGSADRADSAQAGSASSASPAAPGPGVGGPGSGRTPPGAAAPSGPGGSQKPAVGGPGGGRPGGAKAGR